MWTLVIRRFGREFRRLDFTSEQELRAAIARMDRETDSDLHGAALTIIDPDGTEQRVQLPRPQSSGPGPRNQPLGNRSLKNAVVHHTYTREKPVATIILFGVGALVLLLSGISQCSRSGSQVGKESAVPIVTPSPTVSPTMAIAAPPPITAPPSGTLILAIGHEAHAHSPNGGPIFAATTLSNWNEYQKALRARDRDGLYLMAFQSKLVTIDEGARVLVIDTSCEGGFVCTTIYRVRLLEGTLVGDAGWITREFLGP